MKDKKGNLTGVISSVAPATTVAGALTGMIPLIPLWLGSGLLLAQGFPSLQLPWWGVALAGLLLSAVLLSLQGTSIRRWVMPAGLVLTAVFCLVFHRVVFSGMETLANDVLGKLTAATGRIHLGYADAGNVLPALIPVVLLLALLFTAAVLRGSLLPTLPAVLALIAGTVYGIVKLGPGWALFALGLILAAGAVRSLKATAGRVVAVAACTVLALGVGLLFHNTDFSSLSSAAVRRVHEWRYDDASNSMPEGRIADLGPWKKNDAEALAVTMEAPQKLYLRGHVYEVYTGSAWESIPNEELAESEALFYWLHESGFYGQGQIAAAMALNGGKETQYVDVENLSACSENAYLPYGFADTVQLDADLIGDTKTENGITRFELYSGSLPEWYDTQYDLAQSQEDGKTEEYLVLEQSYAAYVKEHDLQLTQESWNVLCRQLGEANGTHSLCEIQQRIRDYLEEHMHYDENVYTLSGSGDFLHYVLESSDGGGWSVQYATAAALMLRYYGVPSRYVEGYYLTPEQAERAGAGETLVLTEKNAHAWAEVYLNGVGFVPFEVTPGYIDPEDLDLGPAASEDGRMRELSEYESDPMAYARTLEPDTRKPEVGEKDAVSYAPYIWIAAAAVILGLFAIVLQKRLRLRKKLKEIERADDRDAVALRYGYAMALKERAAGVTVAEDAAAAKLNEMALFSRKEIAGSERAQMDAYADRVLEECRRKWKLTEKFRLRWIEGIY